ncbi:MAG: family N-acetyltransferase [Bacteroidota bacterium]|nr:family N-acetyltransferase [Bacteroidota bacterium]
MQLNFREATLKDIKEMHAVRNAVTENKLRNPLLVTENDYIHFLSGRGNGWLCEAGENIVGFVIVDMERNNVWAMFVRPDFEKKGIGKKLHNMMLDWFFNQTEKTLWLGTAHNTRAEKFYKLNGWKEVGLRDNGEIKFEMSFANWKALSKK